MTHNIAKLAIFDVLTLAVIAVGWWLERRAAKRWKTSYLELLDEYTRGQTDTIIAMNKQADQAQQARSLVDRFAAAMATMLGVEGWCPACLAGDHEHCVSIYDWDDERPTPTCQCSHPTPATASVSSLHSYTPHRLPWPAVTLSSDAHRPVVPGAAVHRPCNAAWDRGQMNRVCAICRPVLQARRLPHTCHELLPVGEAPGDCAACELADDMKAVRRDDV